MFDWVLNAPLHWENYPLLIEDLHNSFHQSKSLFQNIKILLLLIIYL